MDEDRAYKSHNHGLSAIEESSQRERERFPDLDSAQRLPEVTSEEVVRKVQEGRNREASRKKWGWILFSLGVITVLDSCSVVPIPLVGPMAIYVGAALAVIGAGILASRRKMKDTNEAIMVAMKYGNRLTIARLSLEMDLSLTKAEKIIRKLVESGIAEIDLDQDRPDDGIVYKIKGL
jgi:predicted transcriptional regulator